MGNSRTEPYRQVVFSSIIIFFIALSLTSYTAKNPALAGVGVSVATGILRPFQSFHGWIVHSVDTLWGGYIKLVGTKADNLKLRQRLSALEAENSKLMELKHENQRLKDLLDFKTVAGYQGVVANVIAYDPSNWSHVVTLDQGARSNISVGMPAVVGDGVVGQIISASADSSRLLLVTDPGSGIDAILQDKRVRGIVTGVNRFKASWNYVLATADVQVGERVVTSGLDGVYPKGLLVGVVKSLVPDLSGRLFSKIEIDPAVDFTRVESVFVITDSGKEATSGIVTDKSKNENKID